MTLYLCAHKCRGEPTFSICEKGFFDGDEDDEFYVETVGGHRVHPYWVRELDWIVDWEMARIHDSAVPEMPTDARDCFKPSTSKEEKKGPSQLLARLGLLKKPEPIRRRSVT